MEHQLQQLGGLDAAAGSGHHHHHHLGAHLTQEDLAEQYAVAQEQYMAAAQQQQLAQQAGEEGAQMEHAAQMEAHAAHMAAVEHAAAMQVAAVQQHAMGGPPASELLAGLYVSDPSQQLAAAMQYGSAYGGGDTAAALAAQMQMTPEQVQAYLAAGLPMGYGQPEAEAMAAAAAAASVGGEAPAVDPSFLQHYAAVQAGMMGMGQHAQQAATPPPPPGPALPAPTNDRRFWQEGEQQELLRLASDPGYRQQALGVSELNWESIAKHLGRGKRSVQRKYDNLKNSANQDGGVSLPVNDGKKWATEEVQELVKLVEDPAHLKERLQLDKVDWRILGVHFGRSYEAVSYKYSYVKNTGRTDAKAKHAKAKHDTSYKEMAITALQALPGAEGTSSQICQVIAARPDYAPQLDLAIVSGKKTLQRWKHGVRSALNAFLVFRKTALVREGEVVWQLDTAAVERDQGAQRERQARTRKTATPVASGSVPRRRPKRPAGEGEGEEAAQQEEGAHVLATMSHPASGRPRRKRGRTAAAAEAEAAEAEAAVLAAAQAADGDEAAAHAQALAMQEALMQAGVPLLQQVMEPMTAEQLAALQVQFAQAGGTLPVLPLVLPEGGDADAAAAQAAAAVAAQQAAMMEQAGVPPMTAEQLHALLAQAATGHLLSADHLLGDPVAMEVAAAAADEQAVAMAAAMMGLPAAVVQGHPQAGGGAGGHFSTQAEVLAAGVVQGLPHEGHEALSGEAALAGAVVVGGPDGADPEDDGGQPPLTGEQVLQGEVRGDADADGAQPDMDHGGLLQ